MTDNLRISGLWRYPLKSGMSEALSQAYISQLGIEGDRRYLLIDQDGKFITARKDPKLLSIRLACSDALIKISVGHQPERCFQTYANSDFIDSQVWARLIRAQHVSDEIDRYLSEFLGRSVRMVVNSADAIDLADKRYSWGPIFSDGYPLLITTVESLEALNLACGGQYEMARFRPNILISGNPAWDEHNWRFLRIGNLVLRAEKPCERCVLITRDPVTGEKNPEQQPLRSLAQINRTDDGAICFGHNFSVVQAASLAIGDAIELLADL